MNNDCIFCKMIAGEMASHKIYEDENFIVVLDKFPSIPGHSLIIPKKHIENIFEMDEDLSEEIFKLAVKISKALRVATKCEGLNLLQNNGKIAGQTVNHFHLHIIPRFDNDNVKITWNSSSPSDSELDSVLSDINKSLADMV